ncbi:MAG: polyprenyl synthetase family protein [Campylobacteraceae bacterium]
MVSLDLKETFEEFLKKELVGVESFHPHFSEAYRKMFEAGGKRFRPFLLLSIVKATNPLLLKSAMYVALALEMIHTYSLIHDDLPSMDNSPLRRGFPTLHVTYDEVTAILIADALNTDAFLVLSRMPIDDKTKVKLTEILAFNAGSNGMVLGQAIDCFFEDKKLDVKELEFLHVNKTGRLIAASLQMGAVIGGVSEKLQNELYEFGLKLGLLFQINDDIIDATKTALEVGKPTNNDVHKNSFINLLGVKEATAQKEKLTNELISEAAKFGTKIESELKNILQNKIK